MCQACFDEHWEGRSAFSFVVNLPTDRRAAVDRFVLAMRLYPWGDWRNETPTGTTYTTYPANDDSRLMGCSGPLHVGVEDENLTPAYRGLGWPDVHETNELGLAVERPPNQGELLAAQLACDAWDALSEDERSIACSLLFGR